MASVRQSIAPVTALLISVALLLMGNGLQGTLLPVRGNLEMFSDVQIGILGSCYYVGFTLGCLAAPLLIARVGHIRAYLAFVSLASTVALVHAAIVNPVLWWVLRGITGFCFAVLFVIIESWLNERSVRETRGTIFSIYTIINLTVITVGQMMLVLSDPSSFPLFALASILVSLAGVPVALSRAQSPDPIPVVMPRLSRLFALSPIGVLGCLAVGLANGAFWSLGPVFAMESGRGSAGIALFMSATVLGGAVGQWPFGRLSDLIDRRLVILANCTFAGVAGLVLSYFHQSPQASLIGLGFVYGVFAFPLYALSVAHANDFAAPTDHVETSSGLLLVFGIGSIIGPTLASLVDGLIAHQSLFTYMATIYLLTACFVIWRIAHREPAAEEDKGDFSDALIATRTAAPFEFIDKSDVDDKPELQPLR